MFEWGDYQYEISIERYNGHITSFTTYSEEGVKEALDMYKQQVVCVKRVQIGTLKEGM